MRYKAVMGGLVLAASAAQAQWPGEFLLPAADAGFRLGWIAPSPTEMREYVPAGETVENWTRMVTVMNLPYRPGLTPRTVVTTVANAMQASCAGGTIAAVEEGMLGTHTTATVRVDCPRNPATGKPETMFQRAVLGDEGIAAVQAATRRVPTAADVVWAEKVLGSVELCGARAGGDRCGAARTATVGASL